MRHRSLIAAASALLAGIGGVFVSTLSASAATTTTTIEDTSLPASAYTGTWAECSGNCNAAADGSFEWTSTAGAAVTFSFTGTSVALFGMKEPWDNIGTVSIDGGAAVDVDYYAATATTSTVQVYSSPTLNQGTHTLTLTETSRRNPAGSATGNSITFDKAVVTSATTTTPPPSTTTIEDTSSSGVAYTGTWSPCSGNCTLAADGSFKWTSTAGSAVTVSFTGTQIAVYGEKEPWDNIATASIDGGATTDVDYYAATATTSTVQVYSSPTLNQGTHTLTLTETSRRNPAGSATGNSITFDKAVVTSNGTTTTTPPATTRLSGLAWNSGVWADQDPTETASFLSGVRGGVQLDNYLVYASRASFSSENDAVDWKSHLPGGKLVDSSKQDLVLGLASVTADGASMTNGQGKQIGTSLCGIDPTPIVRLDWEMNLPDDKPGANGAELNSGNLSTWVARFNAVATGIKSTCPGTRIDFNPNHGGDQTSGCSGTTCTRTAFQAVKANVDIYGVDTYDTYPPVKADNSGWNNRLTGANELDDARKYALANNKKFSVPEWGVWCVPGSSGCTNDDSNTAAYTGDDPKYVDDMLTYFHTHAADMAYETYFNETATYILSDLTAHNPNSRAKYKADILGFVGN